MSSKTASVSSPTEADYKRMVGEQARELKRLQREIQRSKARSAKLDLNFRRDMDEIWQVLHRIGSRLS